jgi:FkbM family methyltransferase
MDVSDEAVDIFRASYQPECDRLVHSLVGKNILRPGMIVLDIGSNIGMFTAGLLRIVPDARCHLFEPVKRYFDVGARTFASDPRVTTNNVGLSNKPEQGRMIMVDRQHNPGWNTYVIEETRGQNMQPEPTNLITLSDYCANMDSIDLVKIDTEGFEAYVIEGFIRKLCDMRRRGLSMPHLLVEVGWGIRHPQWKYARSVYEQLFMVGYQRVPALDTLTSTADVLFVPQVAAVPTLDDHSCLFTAFFFDNGAHESAYLTSIIKMFETLRGRPFFFATERATFDQLVASGVHTWPACHIEVVELTDTETWRRYGAKYRAAALDEKNKEVVAQAYSNVNLLLIWHFKFELLQLARRFASSSAQPSSSLCYLDAGIFRPELVHFVSDFMAHGCVVKAKRAIAVNYTREEMDSHIDEFRLIQFGQNEIACNHLFFHCDIVATVTKLCLETIDALLDRGIITSEQRVFTLAARRLYATQPSLFSFCKHPLRPRCNYSVALHI